MSRRATQALPLRLGRPVRCDDGTAGRLGDVIVEPRERRVTHLVVAEPEGRARLVPARLLRPKRTRNLTVLLSCNIADVLACESIRSFAFVGIDGFPKHDEHYDIGVEETIVVPSFGASEFGSDAGDPEEGYGVTYDRIPTGSAELRRASPILSSEGDSVGHVDGFLVEGDRLTHVVLHSGHGLRPRPVAIPVVAVKSIETDRIMLTMPKDAVASVRRGPARWLPGLTRHPPPGEAVRRLRAPGMQTGAEPEKTRGEEGRGTGRR